MNTPKTTQSIENAEVCETPTGAIRTRRIHRSGESSRASLLFAAQAMTYQRRKSWKGGRPGYKVLPSYTPNKSSGRPRSVVNPFNDGLLKKLSEPTCSPDLFSGVESPSDCTEFHWTIDEISRIRPAPIDSPASIADECIDDETESQAQEAIEQYFSITHNVTSPADAPGPWMPLDTDLTPEDRSFPLQISLAACHAVSTPCSRQMRSKGSKVMNTVGVQTALSLCKTTPEEAFKSLEPFVNEKAEELAMTEDCNTSINTLRRKLFSQPDGVVSPVRCNYTRETWDSNMKVHQWTPEKSISPPSPDVSPIMIKSDNLEFSKRIVSGIYGQEMESRVEIFSSTRAQTSVSSLGDTGYNSGEMVKPLETLDEEVIRLGDEISDG